MLQLLRRNVLFLWRHEDTSSLRLLSDDNSGRRMMSNFSLRRRLHLKVWSLCFFPPIATYTALYSHVSSTVKRKNHYTDFLIRSRLRLVEHSTIIRDGKIRYWLVHKEYSSSIAKRLLSSVLVSSNF